jgi:murein DD-endopeptidase MepM/ murein hydrolase activator NlpD
MARARSKRDFLTLTFLFAIQAGGWSQVIDSQPYPTIETLSNKDALFVQLSQDVARFHMAFTRSTELPPLMFFRYTAQPGEDLYAIAARTNLGVTALATLNGQIHADGVLAGKELVLPNMPGLFVPLSPENDLERITFAFRKPFLEDGVEVWVVFPRQRRFVFLPNETFSTMERAYFLDILFGFPIRGGTISSEYGPRSHPFTGADHFHSGIDIAAQSGTGVVAARSGTVVSVNWSDGLGNHIIIDHGGGFQTLYGHLESVNVSLSQVVDSGTIIGAVGSTGLSTGPHLHFEVKNGEALRDPIPLMRGAGE